MNAIKQHIPAFVDVEHRPGWIPFDTTDELLNLDVVRRYRDEKFHRWSKSGDHLMVESDEGYEWWVVGFLKDAAAVDLPAWKAKYLARLADGREVTLTDETTPRVWSSCGGHLKLSDGTTAVNVRSERQMAQQAEDRELELQGLCPQCRTAFERTETLQSDGFIKARDVCLSCGRSITSWRPVHT